MTFTPFTFAFGSRQGRIQPRGFDPPNGDFAMVLGSDLLGDAAELEVGDSIEINQSIDLTTGNFFRAQLRLRNAGTLPSDINWQVSIVVDGIKASSMTVAQGRQRDRFDMAANVSKLSGFHTVGFRLELILE